MRRSINSRHFYLPPFKFKSLFSLFFILYFFNAHSQSWIQVDDFPATERDDGTSFVIGNKAYCGTGYKTGWVETRDFHSMNMSTDQWTSIASMPSGEERQYASGFSSATHGYIFGGLKSGNYLKDIWMYDPTANNWSEKSVLPDVGRRGAASFIIDNIAYIIGGNTLSNNAIDEVWAYDMDNDSWQQKGDFPFGNIYRSSASSHNNKGYLIFGKDENNEFQNKLYEYNPISDAWTLKSTFPGLGRMHSSLNTIANKLFVIGGMDNLSDYYSDLWSYNLIDETWEQLISIPSTERRGGMSFNNGTNLYYTAGIDPQNTRLKETWKCVRPLNIETEIQEIGLSIYPNPTTDKLNLAITNYIPNHNYHLIITDNYGKEIIRKSLTETQSEIDISQLAKGIYFVRIQINESLQVLKFVKQ